MSNKFKARNYPTRILDLESSKALNVTEATVPTTVKNPRLPFIHNHHPTMHRIHNLIRGHWPLLSKAYPHIPIFRDPPLMSMRRPQNVRDRVVRADLGTSRTPALGTLSGQKRTGTFPCLSCMCCSNVIKGNEILHPRTGKAFPIKEYYTCNSNFVVYLIMCPCGLLYVGETTQAIKSRISSHKSTISTICEQGRNVKKLTFDFSYIDYISVIKMHFGTNLPAGRFGGRTAHAPAILEDGGAQGEDGRDPGWIAL
ncbi:unnamed protein product [Ranitomeya imitator]|uniref:GIY-YIG domain-containing protein n=1 Tax=Ranitomeya imitator TaxID=111125 RepID=A0ABN9M8Q3_9NEOB|nr:unnamed protein product [Ranitomeya imitator]